MANRLFNTTHTPGMLPKGYRGGEFIEVDPEEATAWLQKGDFENVANPSHGNTLSALTRMLGVDLTAAKGGRVVLAVGDEVLVALIDTTKLPRETREYTDAEIAAAAPGTRYFIFTA